MSEPSEDAPPVAPPRRVVPIAWAIVIGTGAVLTAGTVLAIRARRSQNGVALAEQPKVVGTIAVQSDLYRVEHRYVGTLLPWQEAKLGPQFLSGYVTEVRVRPGEVVHKGEALAIIEPERAKAQNLMAQKQAEAIKARLTALTNESGRIQELEKKGIVSVNDSENKLAEVRSEKATLEAAQAQMATTAVECQDSIQRAPFDGEVADRYLDPGTFVRPGSPILTVVDRSRVICGADAPEEDHPFLAVGRPVHLTLLADGRQLDARISRVSPGADPTTRTIHFELDLDNQDRSLPVGTTSELVIQEPQGRPVVGVPSAAAQVEGDRAIVFVQTGDRVHRKEIPFLGERDGRMYLAPDLPDGTQVVSEGRSQLEDGEKVAAGPAAQPPQARGTRP